MKNAVSYTGDQCDQSGNEVPPGTSTTDDHSHNVQKIINKKASIKPPGMMKAPVPIEWTPSSWEVENYPNMGDTDIWSGVRTVITPKASPRGTPQPSPKSSPKGSPRTTPTKEERKVKVFTAGSIHVWSNNMRCMTKGGK